MENSMENKDQGMLKPALYYGLLTAVVLMIITLMFYMLGQSANRVQNWIGYVVMIGGLFYGIKSFRDQHRGGFISYGQSLGFGTMIGLFIGLITGVFVFVFYQYIAPDAIAEMLVAAEEKMLQTNPNMTDQEYDIAIKAASMFMKPSLMAVLGVIGSVFMCFIFSLILSIFLKKEEKLETV